VTLWNPHGDSFMPRGPDGPDRGWRRRRGVFTVRLDDFASVFGAVVVER
jgi:hypothetical protein